jgi:Protein of unknown function (DUF2924)
MISASVSSSRSLVGSSATEGEIDRIRSLGLEELRREWRRLYHAEPPRLSRGLFILALGYRLQEIEHGGLGKATRRLAPDITRPSSMAENCRNYARFRLCRHENLSGAISWLSFLRPGPC